MSAAARFGPAVRAFVACLLIAGAGLGYVWLKNQIFELGRQIARREMRLEELRSYNKRLTRHLAELLSPRALDARVRELNLGLGPPRPEQILRLREEGGLAPDPSARVELARHEPLR